MSENKLKPVLTLKSAETGKTVCEVYMLNPGQHFPGFGGSRHGLTVQKTASIIVRDMQGGCITDVEHDITDGTVWAWLARLINDRPGITAHGPEGATG